MRSKAEIEAIDNLIKRLCNQKKSIDRNLPKYLYHFTDIENAISILKCGFIGSRNYVQQKKLMINENASSEVINYTEEENKNYVRFYFRPKTPTQYHNEGIKSSYKDYEFDSHCPIPIFFLFDSLKMLSRENSRFVEKNLAKSPPIKSTIKELECFDFEKIYHLGPIHGDREIIEKRHAEVLFKDTCDLNDLEIIVCRSSAEKELLINLLIENGINIDSYKIGVDKRSILFNKSRAYINYVDLERDYIKIGFNNFNLLTVKDEISLSLTQNNKEKIKSINHSSCIDGLNVTFNPIEQYTFKIYLNNKLIYYGNFNNESEIPY